MISLEQAKAYLAELGYEIPDAILGCLITTAERIQDCLDANGYPACTQDLIYYYLVGMLAISNGARRIKSQAAPNGASRSFDYPADQLKQLRQMLRVLDPAGCSTSLQPADPNSAAAMFIGLGSCVE